MKLEKLLEDIRNHLASLPPHVRDRRSTKLLSEAYARLEQFEKARKHVFEIVSKHTVNVRLPKVHETVTINAQEMKKTWEGIAQDYRRIHERLLQEARDRARAARCQDDGVIYEEGDNAETKD